MNTGQQPRIPCIFALLFNSKAAWEIAVRGGEDLVALRVILSLFAGDFFGKWVCDLILVKVIK